MSRLELVLLRTELTESLVLPVLLLVGAVAGQTRLTIGDDCLALDEPGDGRVVGQEVALPARAVRAGSRAFVMVGPDLVSVSGLANGITMSR